MRALMLRGLYAIADRATLAEREPAAAVEAALAGGAALVQYRDKGPDTAGRRRREAAAIVALCQRHGVPAVINDDVDLAVATGADGVHLGADDADPARARARLGVHAIIGASCYADRGRALRAAAAGVDYVALGRVRPSRTKPGGPHAPLALLGEVRAATRLPVCAIGGITLADAEGIIAAGADMLAVIGDLFTAADIRARAAAYAALFEPA